MLFVTVIITWLVYFYKYIFVEIYQITVVVFRTGYAFNVL